MQGYAHIVYYIYIMHIIYIYIFNAFQNMCYTLHSHRGSFGKDSICFVGELGSILGLRWSPGEGNGYPFQYSCLENSMDRGAWQATVHGVSTWLSDLYFALSPTMHRSFYFLTYIPMLGKPRYKLLYIWGLRDGASFWFLLVW